MGVGYVLVNLTKQEQIMFACLPVSTAKEVCGNPVSAAVVSWYLLRNSGDLIRFVDDVGLSGLDVSRFPDRTDQYVKELVDVEVLEDRGIVCRDEDEPETVFLRDVRNCWMDGV